MNINKLYIPKYTDTQNNNICNRAKLDTGTFCNYKCDFCYYIDLLDVKTSFDIIKNKIDYLHACEITEVDLSGGESSIHNDWFKILDYCTSLDMKISCLSNGSMFANYDFLEKSKNHGLTEILFSVHGYDSDTHDNMVNHKGAFIKILKAIDNAKKLGIKVRFNCTVTNKNYKELSTKYADLINDTKPEQVNFLTLNYWDNAGNIDFFPYKLSTDEIKKTIDIIKDNIKHITVRYTPFCYMKDYEEYVCSTYQHIYDLGDWNIAVYDYKISPEIYKANKKKYMFDAAESNRNNTYYKPMKCKECKYVYICDGVENKNEEVYPIKGNTIKDII